MGPRPDDFDEVMVRKSPTFQKWEALAQGGKVRYIFGTLNKPRVAKKPHPFIIKVKIRLSRIH